MKPSLQVRLSQHLALTPQLQQSIRLLQLSTLELHQEVGQMLDQNPFLEAEDDSPPSPYDTPPERQAADRAGDSDDGYRADAPDAGEAVPEIRAEEFGTPEREDWENGTERDDFDGIREMPSTAAAGSGEGDGDDVEAQDRRAAAGSLQDHLRAQIVGMRLGDDDRAALEVLLESLDGDGYLADPLEEIAERLADMLGPDREEARDELDARLRCALQWLQSLEPTGVGARTLAECLQLQLRTQPPGPARELAMTLCELHLELLARRDMRRLTALTGADEDLVRQAQALITACEPKPGRPFGGAEAAVVVPDVIVRKTGRGLSVTLNPDVMPKLRINDIYAHAIRGQRGNGAAAAAGQPTLSSRLQEARWFVKNIQQRFDTILRVSKAIVERQKGFFTHGAIAMKPLVLREIADELGLHESTISRVTTAKYMATPQGTFELKYFFGSSLNTEAGGNASSTAVRALIQQLVAAEPTGKPLSDSQLSLMLEEQGIQVARRTVAKYREALRIAPAGQRKAI
ncbi:MAG: RNA polymerase factor sigma-54 [Rubrivivax sp.]|jgi:RNA polymerase sigma-54 factor|nr:RNA polymerase factor sigma-54 [Betaproteobacteria bacterium]MBP6319255.1 RNA polymerase factor sigma-54 [Rubrivivax sp.]MBK7275706.1 RNA polymerase factor sigma-54 [Betaproteobacteria bacterium]MBK7460628.1 RNA polymerase factor sigma-54 [Betaproteobacteria bacterium]MBK7516963.1 RNA polymerase factor sigma-54 [Betaproteobacteria bacterium]